MNKFFDDDELWIDDGLGGAWKMPEDMAIEAAIHKIYYCLAQLGWTAKARMWDELSHVSVGEIYFAAKMIKGLRI